MTEQPTTDPPEELTGDELIELAALVYRDRVRFRTVTESGAEHDPLYLKLRAMRDARG